MVMPPPKPPLALIAGPTASGKSALALALAEQIGGVIVNADSAQLYRDLRILSAAPTADGAAARRHRLYGVRDGALPCSAADWAATGAGGNRRHPRERADCRSWSAGLACIFAPCSTALRRSRRSTRTFARAVRDAPVEDNRAELATLDPRPRRGSTPADTTRIARALEVILSTGRTLGEWQQQREGGIGGEVELRPLILLPPRDWLYARCDERFARMIDRGAVERSGGAARAQAQPQPAGHARDRRAGDRRPICSASRPRDEAIAAGQQATRRYAKRQYTWFAHQPPADWPRFRSRSTWSGSAKRWPCSAEAARRARMDLLRDADIDPAPLAGKRVAIIGYGNQGRAQALNLHDSGIDVVVGLRGGSGSAIEAEAAGLEIALIEDAVASADVVMMLAPDEIHAALYREIEPHLRARRGARLQPWAVDPLRLHRAARRPRRLPGRAQRARAPRSARSTARARA